MTEQFVATKLEDIHWEQGEPLYALDMWGLIPIRQIITLIDSGLTDLETDDMELVTNLIVLVNRLGQLVEDVQETFNRLNTEHFELEKAKAKKAKDPEQEQIEKINLKSESIETLLKTCQTIFTDLKPRLTALEKGKAELKEAA